MNGVELKREMIRVAMDHEAAEHMQNDGIIEVKFRLTDPEFEKLKLTLQEIFNGLEYFSVKG